MGSERRTTPTSSASAGATPGASLTLAVAARMIERSLDELSLPQFRVLALIASSPERAGRIATLTGISRPTLTGLVDGLEGHGYVQRVTVDGDRRGVGLEITLAGRAALDRAQHAIATRLDEVLDATSPTDRRAAVDGLAALGRAFAADRARRHEQGDPNGSINENDAGPPGTGATATAATAAAPATATAAPTTGERP